MLSPNGYVVRVTKHGTTSPSISVTRMNHREAERECIREAVALGEGTRGEVLGGPKLDSIILQGRVILTNGGKPKFKREEP